MARVVTVRAYAKVNLGLRVRERRRDGYHELLTIFQSVGLYDTLTFRRSRGPFRLRCTRDDVPVDQRNLVWRAAERLWTAMGRAGAPEGVSVVIRKRIPPQAGLGGGSADAAAAIVALKRLWRARVPAKTLEGLAATLGSDVPFFLSGGTALGLGRGDEIHRLADLPRTPVVVAYPSFGVSTAEAFGWFDRQTVHGHSADDSAGGQIVNDLERCVVRHRPAIGKMLRRLRKAGAVAAAMSGSGSAVFGLFPDAARASRAAARLNGRGWTALATRTLTRREVRARLSGRCPVV